MAKKLRIAVSEPTRKLDEYIEYLKSTKFEVDYKVISYDNEKVSLKNFDALVLTGGIDIHPSRYGKENEIELCGKIDPDKDEFEINLISEAIELGLPIFGICRGMQIVNIHPNFGGTMICDIKKHLVNSNIIHSTPDFSGVNHSIQIEENTVIKEINLSNYSVVNSYHHQAVEKIGNELKICAKSEDGIIESLVRNENGKPLILLVQWHPERMEKGHPLSTGILEYFFKQIN